MRKKRTTWAATRRRRELIDRFAKGRKRGQKPKHYVRNLEMRQAEDQPQCIRTISNSRSHSSRPPRSSTRDASGI